MKNSFRTTKLVALFLFIIMALSVVGCSKKTSTVENTTAASVTGGEATTKADEPQAREPLKAGEQLKIYTSIYPMYYLTSRIAGDKAQVENLVPSGVEAHDWEPNVEDIVKLNEADVLVYNGAGMEHWVEDVGASLNNDKLVMIEASKGLDLIEGGDCCGEEHEDADHHDHEHDHDADEHHDEHHDHDHDADEHHDHDHEHGEEGRHHHHHGKWDPHVWLSPVKAKEEAKNIADKLSELDPNNAETFAANYKALADDLDKLDGEFREGLKDIKSKLLVTNHQAFAYLAKEYGLEQEGITGVYADQEPSAQRMAEIVDFVKEHGVKVIFAEEILSPKVSEAIAEASGATVEVLSPVESLSKEQSDKGDDYLAVMRSNLEALKKALK